MALIVEDGSIVLGANTFVTDLEFTNYAELRGFTLPLSAIEREPLLILAIDYIFSVECKLQGIRTSDIQELPYPRQSVCYNNTIISSNQIPQALKNAQMELGIQANNSGLLINSGEKNIQREKLEGLEVSYFNGGSWSVIRTDRANAYLDPLYANKGQSNIMQRVY